MNFLIVFLAALVPTLTGFIYYNPKVMGNAWMRACGLTEEQLKGANMAVMFSVSLLLSILLAFQVYLITVHQAHIDSLFANMADNAAAMADKDAFLAKYGTEFRTFKHGAFHGVLTGIFFVLPVLATNAMFERKGWKYIWINTTYWTITIAIMGGIICEWV